MLLREAFFLNAVNYRISKNEDSPSLAFFATAVTAGAIQCTDICNIHCPFLLSYVCCGPVYGIIDSQAFLNLLLYGNPKFKETDNRIALEASIAYIKATNRLN